MVKISERTRAVALRKKGSTYSEILTVVPVAKSTLSVWLREVGMAERQQQRITKKKRASQLRGGARKRQIRLEKSQTIRTESFGEVGSMNHRELLLIGAALYWAEGSKEKEYSPSAKFRFSNSDADMVRVYMRWLREVLLVKNEDILVTLYIHMSHKHRVNELHRFWLDVTKLGKINLSKPVYKKHNPLTKRRNIGEEYRGLISIYVRNGTDINRRVQGWIYGIIGAHADNCQIV